MSNGTPGAGPGAGTAPAVRGDRIRESLLRKAGLTAAQIEDALKTERETGQQLDQVLVGKNLLSETKCLEFFAQMLGLEFRPSLDGVGVPGVASGGNAMSVAPSPAPSSAEQVMTWTRTFCRFSLIRITPSLTHLVSASASLMRLRTAVTMPRTRSAKRM